MSNNIKEKPIKKKPNKFKILYNLFMIMFNVSIVLSILSIAYTYSIDKIMTNKIDEINAIISEQREDIDNSRALIDEFHEFMVLQNEFNKLSSK